MMEKTIKELLKAIRSSDTKKTNPYDTSATVTRVENGVAYVHIPGGVEETPVKLTVNVQPGDEVQIRVGGGQAWITGNETAPPTDDKVANVAAETAMDAARTAAEAGSAAASAAQAADTAWRHANDAAQAAESAQNSLKSVVAGAVTVEKAVSVMQTALEAVVDYDPSTDTTKEYFWHDANGAHVLGTSGDYRNDIDSTGMKIVDTSTETTVAEFGETVRVGKESEAHLSMTNSSLKGEDSDGERTFEITSVGASVPIERLYDAGFRITIPAQERDATGDLQISSVIGESLEAVGVATIYIKYGIADIIDEDDLKLAQVQYGTPVSYQLSTYSTPFQEVSLSYDGDDTITFYIKVSAPYSYDLALQSDYIGLVRGTSASNFVFGNGVASGLFSFSAGEGTDAQAGQSVFGKFNKRDDDAALIVGNGATSATRSNAFTVDWNGKVSARGTPLVYVPGDTLTIANWPTSGYVTSGGQDVLFYFCADKILSGVTGFNISSLTVNLRHVGGGYVGGSDYNALGDVNAKYIRGNYIYIRLRKTAGYGVTNNTPVCGEIASATITFT